MLTYDSKTKMVVFYSLTFTFAVPVAELNIFSNDLLVVSCPAISSSLDDIPSAVSKHWMATVKHLPSLLLLLY